MTDLEVLKLFREFLNSLRATNSRLAKEKVLEVYADTEIKEWLPFIYNYDIQFYVTSDNIKKNKELVVRGLSARDSLAELLIRLSSRTITGHEAISECNAFINMYAEYADIIYNILDKDLKCGVGVSIIKKYFDNVKDFEVQLAEKYNEKTAKKVDNSWFISKKLDGCRLLSIFDSEGKVTLLSRQGKPFETLDNLKTSLEKLGLKDKVLDGEVCLVDDDGKENFQGIMKEIRRKNHTIKNPKYFVFDIINKFEFENKEGFTDYERRYDNLKSKLKLADDSIVALEQVMYSPESFEGIKKRATAGDWEGLILRGNVPYEGKRSNYMLKYKLFEDAEYKVEDVEFGKKPMLANGTMQEVDCVAALIINHKGYKVNVGSGLSDVQRLEWFKDPKEIIGKTITVKYFEQTTDKDGKLSLRFPTLKAIYDGERDV